MSRSSNLALVLLVTLLGEGLMATSVVVGEQPAPGKPGISPKKIRPTPQPGDKPLTVSECRALGGKVVAAEGEDCKRPGQDVGLFCVREVQKGVEVGYCIDESDPAPSP